jgi:hypothetical protein
VVQVELGDDQVEGQRVVAAQIERSVVRLEVIGAGCEHEARPIRRVCTAFEACPVRVVHDRARAGVHIVR